MRIGQKVMTPSGEGMIVANDYNGALVSVSGVIKGYPNSVLKVWGGELLGWTTKAEVEALDKNQSQQTGNFMTPESDPQRAFPEREGDYCGMKLRDYFAAKAMQGGLAGVLSHPDANLMQPLNWERMAKDAFQAADAMLKARGQ